MNKPNDIIDKLSPIERKIIPHLNQDFNKISELSGLDEISVMRALKFLENKEIVKTETKSKKIIDLSTNGIYYKKNGLPERRLILTLEKKNHISFKEASEASKLSDNEFKAALGALKSKALIEINNGKLSLTASKTELSKKFLEEQLLEILPKEESSLPLELKLALSNLQKRKDIIEMKEEKEIEIKTTDLWKKISSEKLDTDLIEEVTPEVIKNWGKNKKFRHYDIKAPVPKIHGGKKHFVNQAKEYGKRIWLDLGFKEMTGPIVDSSFWVFDSLFTAQDHPAREMQDTFFIKDIEADLPKDKELIRRVKESHEKGISGSKGWSYSWQESEAKKPVLRTHTTGLSAHTLSNLKKEDMPAKFFALGKVFRNETVDWSHGFEFYQTEGIVVDENANFRHLLGYLKEFYKKMGFNEIRFRPSYFPYTEPSVEIEVFHPEKKIWVEFGGAGIFRPEVSAALLGKPIPILAWGQGFDRIIMEYNKIKDLREMYSNDLKQLRNKKFWVK